MMSNVFETEQHTYSSPFPLDGSVSHSQIFDLLTSMSKALTLDLFDLSGSGAIRVSK